MIEIKIPLRLYSLQNALKGHWRERAALAKTQRQIAHWSCKEQATTAGMTGPLTITITRYAPRRLDSDNLAISAKFVRDGIADFLGRDDGDPMLNWQYTQEPSKGYAVRVRIEA